MRGIGLLMRWWRRALAILGLCLLAAVLYMVGGRDVLDALRRVNPASLLGAGVAIIVSTLLGARNVYDLAGLGKIVGFGRFVKIFWRSWALGITLPGHVADMFSTAWQLKRHHSTNLAFIAGRLLTDKGITVACMLLTAALLPYLLGIGDLLLAAWLIGALAAVMLGAWLGVRAFAGKPRRRGSRMAHLQPLVDAAGAPMPLMLRNAALTGLKIAMTGLAYWLVLQSVSPDPPGYVTTTAITSGAGLVAYIPISFNGLGTVEVTAMSLFSFIGVPGNAVLAAYLALRALTLTLAWLPALFWQAGGDRERLQDSGRSLPPERQN